MQTSQIPEIFKAQKIRIRQAEVQPIASRIASLARIKRWIEQNRRQIQDAIFKDFGKPPAEVDLSEIYPVLSEIKHAQKSIEQWTRSIRAAAPVALIGTKSRVIYEPKGVCLIISPWNFPFNLTVAPLVSALTAGNRVILKPSELTPNCSSLIEKMVSELFDPDEVAVIPGGKEVAEQLLKLPFDHIFFTGSPKVGKIVMQNAAQNLSSVTLELGGKSPAVVDVSANLEDTAEKLVWGKFLNCGQTCIAPDYVLVEETVEEALLEHMISYVDKFFDPEGEGIDASNSYSRIISSQHLQRLDLLLSEALDEQAFLECGGVVDYQQMYFAPTIVSKVGLDTRLMQEEIFGPILPVICYSKLSEVIEQINQRPKPLALYVFSESKTFVDRVIKETSSGSMAINDCIIQFMNPNLPFGGVNNSGFGKSHGFRGFQAFSNEKSIITQKTGMTSVKPLYPPYTGLTQKAIDLLLKYL
ncbi:MAG: aldehyde dehydrogenase [Cyclobacteriaceae bacterium]|nr:MAG: aldehyde dehydrogenase [Cyclobacteriaceae bacterium]